MFQVREVDQMERERCQYLGWGLNVEPSTLNEFEGMLHKDFATTGPYPTYVLSNISKLAGRETNMSLYQHAATTNSSITPFRVVVVAIVVVVVALLHSHIYRTALLYTAPLLSSISLTSTSTFASSSTVLRLFGARATVSLRVHFCIIRWRIEGVDRRPLNHRSRYIEIIAAKHFRSAYRKPSNPFSHFSSSGSQLLSSTCQPLRTPVKQIHRIPSYTYLSNSHHAYTATTTSAFGGGTKHKSTPLGRMVNSQHHFGSVSLLPVVVTDNEGTIMSMKMGRTMGASGSLGGLARGDYLNVMPCTSASISSIYFDIDELVTPGFGPCAGSGWPDAVVMRGSGFDDVAYRGEGGVGVGMGTGGGSDDADVDAFILRTLAAVTKGPKERRRWNAYETPRCEWFLYSILGVVC
jgi:hypothetical protein